VWAALRHLGRGGVADLVDRSCALAERCAARLGETDDVEILRQAANQVLLRLRVGGEVDDGHTQRVLAAVQAGGTCYPSGSVAHGGAAIRLSFSNWRTDEDDVERTVGALLAAHTDLLAGRAGRAGAGSSGVG
jgi:glutamate/tyrosine decarboxylase-like PLP-dependent enzyme